MLNIKTIQCNMLAENCYIVNNDNNECIIIDCGAYGEVEYSYIKQYISENNLTPKMHLLTHGHFDHIMGAKWVYETYGCSPTLCSEDVTIYNNFKEEIKNFGFAIDYDLPPVGHCLNDGDTITFGDCTFNVIHTPGHSRGSAVFYCASEHLAFTGDTLFRNSIGRTDLPGGSMFQIINSLRKLTQLPDDTTVYPGHGDKTSIGYELATNPYLDR